MGQSARRQSHPIGCVRGTIPRQRSPDGAEPDERAPFPPALHVLVRTDATGTVVLLQGVLDVLTAPRLADVLADLTWDLAESAGEPVADVVVDVRQVDLLGAAGLGVLAAAEARLTRRGKGLRVVGARPLATRCFKVVGLQALLRERSGP